MSLIQRIAAAIGGIGILALAIWIGTILFVALLIIVPIAAIFLRWRMGRLRKEMEKQRADHAARHGPQEIEVEYTVVEDSPLDERRPPRQ